MVVLNQSGAEAAINREVAHDPFQMGEQQDASAQASSAYHLTVEAPGGRVWSSNDDHSKGAGHWSKVTARRNLWKRDTYFEARHAKIPPLGRIHVTVTIRLRNWRRADAHNYPGASSFKGLLDGLVLAGIVPDDRAEFMEVDMPRLAPLDGGRPRVEVVIRQVT